MHSSVTFIQSKPMLPACSSVARSQGIQRLARRVMPAVRAYADAGGAAGAASTGASGDVPLRRVGGDAGSGSQGSRRRGDRDPGNALARGGGGGSGALAFPGGMPSIFDALMRPFDELLSMPFSNLDVVPEGLRRLAVDVREEDDKYVIKADVPGMDVDQVNVVVDPDDGVLRIEAEREEERDRDEGGTRRVERVYGRFVRAFRLPPDANPEEITAQVKSGELDIVLPKKKEAEQDKSRGKRIPVRDRDREKRGQDKA